MTFDRNKPYNDLPLPPPFQVELEIKAVLKKAITANIALAKLFDAGIARRQTSANYLNKLDELGILTSVKVGREKYYTNLAFFCVLDK